MNKLIENQKLWRLFWERDWEVAPTKKLDVESWKGFYFDALNNLPVTLVQNPSRYCPTCYFEIKPSSLFPNRSQRMRQRNKLRVAITSSELDSLETTIKSVIDGTKEVSLIMDNKSLFLNFSITQKQFVKFICLDIVSMCGSLMRIVVKLPLIPFVRSIQKKIHEMRKEWIAHAASYMCKNIDDVAQQVGLYVVSL